jgi:hypothetical protein
MNSTKTSLWAIALLAFMIGFSSCKGKKALADKGKTPATTEVEPTRPTVEPEIDPEPIQPEKGDPPRSTTTTGERLNTYFDMISSTSNLAGANSNINEALSLFSNPNVPVLIIFYAADGREEFEEPTTISKYLNYVKDVKKSPNAVSEYLLDNNGKIKELVLVRKKF